MADTKISALTAVTTPATTDEFAVNQGGVSKKLTLTQITDFERYLLRADATRNLTSSTSSQALFNVPTNGRLTVPLGTYLFEGAIYLTAMSGTSGNFAFSALGAGTAVMGAWMWSAVGVDGTAGTAVTQSGEANITAASPASIVNAAVNTNAYVRFEGMCEVTTAGTIIPSVTLVTAAAATVAIGTYFLAERVSTSTALTSIGAAD